MGLRYLNLDDRTREGMAEEIKIAIADGSIYLSPRLTEKARADWPKMLLSAARSGTDETLSSELRSSDCLIRTELRRKKNDLSSSLVAVPVTAADTLAEGEFNRFYMKSLCRRAVRDGRRLVVYRGKEVLNPRAESSAKIGSVVEAETLLSSLKTSGVETSLGLPPGPGSGLTIKLESDV